MLALAVLYLSICLGLSLSDPPVSFQAGAVREARPALPSGFLLGTATASYQVEGGNPNSDWAEFEKQPGHIKNGRASDHWNQVSGDIALMKELGANAYRFSLEWSRLEPQEGVWDEAAWAHYEDELTQLRAAGIAPMVTLLHFSLPNWLAARGGLTSADFPEKFARFSREAARRLGGHVDLWCTLNEPNVQMLAGYIDGQWPPAQHDPAQAEKALLGLARGHAAAVKVLREVTPRTKIGIAINLVELEPYSRLSLLDWTASSIASQAYNWALCDSFLSGRLKLSIPGWPKLDEEVPGIRGSVDYFGLNYYTRYLVQFSPSMPGMLDRRLGPGKRTEMDWETYPEGLLRMTRAAWKRYRLPIYITENGVADASGENRDAFIQAHLYAVTRALDEGIPVKGYFHWSLLDNFEWAEGFRPRFGLYKVDYTTYKRTPALGAQTFRKWAAGLAR